MSAPIDHARTFSVRPAAVRQVIRFLVAGVINTGFGYGAFAAFLWLSGNKDVAVVLGTVAGIAFNFGTYGAVFARTGFARLPHFIAFYLAVLGANLVALRLLTSSGANPYLGQAIIILAAVPISFVTMRSWVFAEADRRNCEF